jgi:hypothetical protein
MSIAFTRTRLLLAFITSASLATVAMSSASRAEDWSLEKQEDGITVYTRSVAGSDIKEFKGNGIVEADLESVLAVLRDSDRYQDWFPECPESKLLSREGNVSHQYSVTAAPWPVDDRDNIFRTVLSRDETTGAVGISIGAAPRFYPEQPGRVRVQNAEGSWRLEPEGDQRTRVVFTMHLEPGGGIPAWLINRRIVSTPFGAISNLRAFVAK